MRALLAGLVFAGCSSVPIVSDVPLREVTVRSEQARAGKMDLLMCGYDPVALKLVCVDMVTGTRIMREMEEKSAPGFSL